MTFHITTRWIPALLALIALAPGCATPQKTFSSPDEAVGVFIKAVRAYDKPELMNILGPEGKEIISTSDPIADQAGREQFLAAYDEKHQLTDGPDGSKIIVIGNKDWPLPIPLVQDDKKLWVFDTEAGKEEIINRRIGRNELDVIQVCKAICDAQREYAQRDPNGDGVPEYARKFFSDPGAKNGLYWKTAEGEDPSPLGPLAAEAQGEGYFATPTQTGQPRPYHGYLYRILTAQGKDAPGGPMDYVIDGKLVGGFAVVAWPADYGNSGIMTFITNYTGDVYQKDLGDDTDKLARAMTEYNPDPSWKKAE